MTVQQPDPGTVATARPAPQRASLLGLVLALGLFSAAIWAAGSTAAAYRELTQRSAVTTIEAVPLVLHAVLTIALLWALLLVAMSIAALRRSARQSGRGAQIMLPAGLIGRISTVLIAVTLVTTAGGAATPSSGDQATLSATQVRSGLRDVAPTPGFAEPPVPTFGQGDLPVPGWTAPAPRRASAPGSAGAFLLAGGAHSHDDRPEIVVRRGDSLWALVSRHLHTEDPVVIAVQWPLWYAANRTVIGPDPDVLRIGQVLQLPAEAAATSVGGTR